MADEPLTVVKSEPLPALTVVKSEPVSTPVATPAPSWGRTIGMATVNALPGIGGVAGAVLGGGPEDVPAMALGVGVGRGLRDLIAEKTGLEPETTPIGKASRIALDTALAAATPAVLSRVKDVLSHPLVSLGDVIDTIVHPQRNAGELVDMLRAPTKTGPVLVRPATRVNMAETPAPIAPVNANEPLNLAGPRAMAPGEDVLPGGTQGRLRDTGHSNAAISAMTPADAQAALKAIAPPPPAAVTGGRYTPADLARASQLEGAMTSGAPAPGAVTSRAPGVAAAASSPAQIANAIAIQARRAGVTLTPETAQTAAQMVVKGMTPQQAVEAASRLGAPAAQSPAAAFAARFGLPSDAETAAQIAARQYKR